MFSNLSNSIKSWWKNFNMSPEEFYLSQSSNHADLENRMRELMDPNFVSRHRR